MPPTNTFGLQFALTPFIHVNNLATPTCCSTTAPWSGYCGTGKPSNPKAYDFYKVLALKDGTNIRVVGGPNSKNFSLNARQTQVVTGNRNEYMYLVANQPVSVAHIMQGSHYTGKYDVSVH